MLRPILDTKVHVFQKLGLEHKTAGAAKRSFLRIETQRAGVLVEVFSQTIQIGSRHGSGIAWNGQAFQNAVSRLRDTFSREEHSLDVGPGLGTVPILAFGVLNVLQDLLIEFGEDPAMIGSILV